MVSTVLLIIYCTWILGWGIVLALYPVGNKKSDHIFSFLFGLYFGATIPFELIFKRIIKGKNT